MCSLPADKRGEFRFITLAPAEKKKKEEEEMTDDENIFNYHSLPWLCLLSRSAAAVGTHVILKSMCLSGEKAAL